MHVFWPHVCVYFLLLKGQERFSSLTRVYYKDASACVVMFDISSLKSFKSVVRWKNDVDSKVFLRDMSPVPCLLLANKVWICVVSRLWEICKESGGAFRLRERRKCSPTFANNLEWNQLDGERSFEVFAVVQTLRSQSAPLYLF